jgi:hypothetical protein
VTDAPQAKIVVRVPMVIDVRRTVGAIEKQLPIEIRGRATVRGSLTIDYVDDVVIFEVDAP